MNIIGNLPVPEIIEDTVFQHSFTQNSKKDNQLRPPKLRTRFNHDTNFNRSITAESEVPTQAHAISFRIDSTGQLSSTYNESQQESYFEQCFTNISKLGEGSFGEVFKVRAKEDGRYYAVKMSKQFYRSEQYRQERLEEVHRYEQFSGHSNCLRFYRAWEEDDRLYMQMELCRETLERYAERCSPVLIPEQKIWSILLDLLLALKSLHDRNLIHLDIKLENVLIADDDTCKLADFGLVIDVDRANRYQATEGDSRYMAPEIMQGDFSKSADVFSLGIAVLELSCYLKLPPNGPLWQQLRCGQLPQDFMKNISPELRAIIKQMMTPNPLERPSVNSLLTHRKFVNILKQRKQWSVGRALHFTWKTSFELLQSLIFIVTNITKNFLNVCLSKVLPFKAITPTIPTLNIQNQMTPTPTPQLTYASTPVPNSKIGAQVLGDPISISDRSPVLSCQGTFINNIDLTPINWSHHISRSRKDLTKTSFVKYMESSSDLSKTSLHLEEIDGFLPSLIGKRLFPDDSPDPFD